MERRIRQRTGVTGEAVQVKRKDTVISYGIQTGFGFYQSHKIVFDMGWENRESTVPASRSSGFNLVLKYAYTFPSSADGAKFLRNTERNPLSGGFDGEGG
jgi:hypothetical protein